MKKGIIAIIIIVIVVLVVCFAYKKFMYKPIIPKGQFGYDTIDKLSSKSYGIACNDAKNLVTMIDSINKDFAAHPELSDNTSSDNMTPAMKKFESSMDSLGNAIEKKFNKDNDTKSKAYKGIGQDVAKIFQVAVYNHLGMISSDNLTQFINVNFCGEKPKQDYVNPLAMDTAPMEEVHKGMTVNDNATPSKDNATQTSKTTMSDNKTKSAKKTK